VTALEERGRGLASRSLALALCLAVVATGIDVSSVTAQGGATLFACRYTHPDGSFNEGTILDPRLGNPPPCGPAQDTESISWRIRGPRGARGPAGERGNRGPRGEQGEPGEPG
jgi:hypothetical protein